MITYVSAFFPSKVPKRPLETYKVDFDKMVSTGISIILFLDENLRWVFPENVHVVPTRFSDTWVDQNVPEHVELPTERNTGYDNVEYLKIQHSKTEWVTRAINMNLFQTDWFAWVDFALPHVFWSSETLNVLANLQPPSTPQMFTAGIWGYSTDDIWNRVQWRFAGGFFLGHKDHLVVLHERLKDLVLRTLPKFAWEVNYWAMLEKEGFDFGWFQANHNDSILTSVPLLREPDQNDNLPEHSQ